MKWVQPNDGLQPGRGGWCKYQMAAPDDPPVFVRFVDRGDGRLVLTELYVADTELTTDLLRRIPLGRIQAWANSEWVAEDIRPHMDEPAADLHQEITKSFDAFLTVKTEGLPWDDPRVRPRGGFRLSKEHRAIADSQHRPYPDDFYEAVAHLYQRAARVSRGPAARIADANGVPTTTVHRWVRMARKRKFLPPTSVGKSG